MATKATPTHYIKVGYLKFVGTLAQCQAIQRAMEAVRCVRWESLDQGNDRSTSYYVFAPSEDQTEVGRIDRRVLTAAELQRMEAAVQTKQAAKRPRIEAPKPLLLGYMELPDGGGVR